MLHNKALLRSYIKRYLFLMRLLWAGATVLNLSLLSTACGAMGVLGDPKSPASFSGGAPSGQEATDYCARLRNAASSRAQIDFYAGATFSVLGAAAAGTVTVLIAADTDPGNRVKGIEAGAPIVSAILFYVAKSFFSREDAASELSKQASLALTDGTTSEQVNKCTSALAAWDAARTDAAKIASDLQKDDKQEKQAAQNVLGNVMNTMSPEEQQHMQRALPMLKLPPPQSPPATPIPSTKP